MFPVRTDPFHQVADPSGDGSLSLTSHSAPERLIDLERSHSLNAMVLLRIGIGGPAECSIG